MARSPSEVFAAVKKATVAIVMAHPDRLPGRPFSILGSGFCIHRKGVIVTCEHVWRAFVNPESHNKMQERARNNDGGLYNDLEAIRAYALFFGGVVGANIIMHQVAVATAVTKPNYDLALLKIGPHAAFSSGFPALKIADYDRVHEMMEVATCGYPLGEVMHDQLGTVTSSFTKGMISSIIPAAGIPVEHLQGFQLDLTATNGNSGGPVFSTANGRVIGVLQGGAVHPATGHPVQGITKAEPIYPIFEHDLVERLAQGISIPQPKPPP